MSAVGCMHDGMHGAACLARPDKSTFGLGFATKLEAVFGTLRQADMHSVKTSKLKKPHAGCEGRPLPVHKRPAIAASNVRAGCLPPNTAARSALFLLSP